MTTIRAIYQNGQLRLLEPVPFQEGQEVHLQVVPAHANWRNALSDLLVQYDDLLNAETSSSDATDLQAAIDLATQGLSIQLSQAILDERQAGR